MTSTSSPTGRSQRSPRRSIRRGIVHFDDDDTTARSVTWSRENGRVPLAGFLAEHDIIVNCVLQNPNAPLMFLTDDDLAASRRAP